MSEAVRDQEQGDVSESATTPRKQLVARVNYDAESMLEAFSVYRVARDLCKAHGFPDRGEMSFEMRLEFQGFLSSPGARERAQELEKAAKDLDLFLRVSEEEL